MTTINPLTVIGNGLAANDGTGDTLRTGAAAINANSAAIVTAINNLAASQAAGAVSYLTKADMDADLAHPDGTIALVTNDGTAANNQAWRKSGASGAGSWQVTVDRIASVVGNGSGYQAPWAGAPVTDLNSKASQFISLVDAGADPTGVADISAALDKCVQWLVARGGGTIYGDANHIYNLGADYTITASNITIDLRGAQWIGTGWLKFNGMSGVDGDWSKALSGVYFKNARIGYGVGTRQRAPFFLYCVDSGMENVQRWSYGATGFNMFLCKRTYFRNCYSRGGETSGNGAIGALMYMCQDCTFENLHADEGPFVMGIQVKGGSNNKVKDCTIQNVKTTGTVSMGYAFYLRGDAPWTASPTPDFAHGGYSYPYATGSYAAADEQRATNDSWVMNCKVANCDITNVAFQMQEFVGGGVTGCIALNNNGGTSYAANKLAGGSERNPTFRDNKSFSSAVNGLAVVSADASVMAGAVVQNNFIESATYSAIYVNNTEALVTGNKTHNCSTGSVAGYLSAINVTNKSKVNVSGNAMLDDRAVPLHDAGLTTDATCPSPTVSDNNVSGYTLRPYSIYSPGKFSGNAPGELAWHSTDGVAITQAFVCTPPTGKSMWVEATVHGRDSSGVVGAWKVGGLFVNNGGTVTQQGATAQLMTAINPGAWTGAIMSVQSGTVRIGVQGKAATAIDWRGDIRATLVN